MSFPPVESQTCASLKAAPSVEVAQPTLVVSEKSVSQLLSESRAHNDRRVRLANQKVPDYRAAEREAASALTKRLEAHDRDPDHTDAAWALDKAPHDQIVVFLRGYPGIP